MAPVYPNNLYTKEFRKIMKANIDYTGMSLNLIEQIINVARGLNFK